MNLIAKNLKKDSEKAGIEPSPPKHKLHVLSDYKGVASMRQVRLKPQLENESWEITKGVPLVGKIIQSRAKIFK